MKLVAKTAGKVVLEITTNEIEQKGFDHHWDNIRRVYPSEEYDVYSIGESNSNNQIIFIELIHKRLHE